MKPYGGIEFEAGVSQPDGFNFHRNYFFSLIPKVSL